jgi:hypothetical protein
VTALATLDANTWGTVASWFSAVFSGSALIVAVLILRRESVDRERSQASYVESWEKHFGYNSGPGGQSAGGALVVHNGSDKAIYDVMLEILEWDSDTRMAGGSASFTFPVIRPGATTDPVSVDLVPPKVLPANLRPRTRLLFTDAAGRRWRRQGAKLDRVHRS